MDGALERHPALRVAFFESGTGWLPYWRARLDQRHAWMRTSECAGLRLTPSEYFARQCVISSDPEDPLVAWTAARVGADHLLWANDDGLGAALDAILWETPLRFYALGKRFGDQPPRPIPA